jgi:hypothetical protein
LTLIAVGQVLTPEAIAEKFVCFGDWLSPNYELNITRTEAGFAQLQLNPMIGDVERSPTVISETGRSLALVLHADSIDRYASKMFLIDKVNLVFTAFGFVGEMMGSRAGNGKQFYRRGICAHFP